MDIQREIGQLFTVGFSGKKITNNVIKLIHEYYVGGIILFRENIGTPQELIRLIQDLQQEARAAGYKHPLLIGIDEENGTVKRLGSGNDGYPGAMSLSATQNSQYAYDIGKATGEDLRNLGINWNFAPVLDVNNNPNNPVIGVRSFGETPEQVSEFGIRLMKGLQNAKIATSVKHFPGHGDTNVDSHHSLPIIKHDLLRLEKLELKPFKKAISEGTDSIMTAHILFPALEMNENRPATLSKNVITGLLRDKLNFDGVVVTDALEMSAIHETIGISSAAVEALKAGADNLLIGHLVKEQMKAISRVRKAVKTGEISKERIKESVKRMKILKEKYISWSDLDNLAENKAEIFYNDKYKELTKKIYKESVTLVQEGEKINPNASVLILQPQDELRTIAEDTTADDYTLTSVTKRYIKDVDVEIIGNNLTSEDKSMILEKAKKVDYIILGTISINQNDNLIDFINELSKDKKINIISMKDPYLGKSFKNINYWINTYEMNELPIEIAIQTLLGKIKPSGRSPVTLENLG